MKVPGVGNGTIATIQSVFFHLFLLGFEFCSSETDLVPFSRAIFNGGDGIVSFASLLNQIRAAIEN